MVDGYVFVTGDGSVSVISFCLISEDHVVFNSCCCMITCEGFTGYF